jgi:tetratricopeptide (TPR) repeat protein
MMPDLPPLLRSARVTFTGRLASLPREEAERLVRASGGRVVDQVSRGTSFLVVGMGGWPLSPEGAKNYKLRQTERINRDGPRIRVLSEIEFLEAVGLRDRPPLRKTQAADDIVRVLGIDHQTLRHWQALGLVRAVEGRYDFQDLVSLRAIAELIKNGIRPDVISRSLHDLATLLPDTDRPLAQLKIVADGPKSLLADLDEHLIAPNGQLVMNFDAPAPAAPEAVVPHRTADEWLARGEQFEQNEDFEAAADAYERAISRSPEFAEAHFNLGNVLRALDQPLDAMASFRIALRHDPLMVEASYNLADIQEERGDIEAALDSLQAAVRVDPFYADAHFNLARCLEAVGRKGEAVRHWKSYLRLDSTSEWAEFVRARLTSDRAVC